MRSRLLGIIPIIVAISWSAPLVRIARDAPAVGVAFFRTMAGALILLPFAWPRLSKELGALSRRERLVALSSGALLASHFASWIASVNLTTVSASALLADSSPVFVALGSFALGERPSSRAWMGILCALVGAAVVAGSGRDSSLDGNLLALLGAVAVAGYFLIGRRLRQKLSVFSYGVIVYGSCALFLLAGAIATDQMLWGYTPITWWAIAAMVIGPQLMGHTLINFFLERLEATVIAVVVMAEPIGATLIAALVFDEVPPLTMIPGGLLLLTGIYLAITGRSRSTELDA